jgi:hypothetical protein
MTRLEREWARALGEEVYTDLARALAQLEEILDREVTPSR